MANIYKLLILTSLIVLLMCGCSSFQTTKNVWKGTKDLWATYVSPPATVDYDDKGDLPPQALALSNAMIGIDLELSKLERTMQNADRPPTMEWLEKLFQTFPWINGFAGIKYDGTILGQQPADSLKNLDFNYLLYEDSKQKSRALRTDVQPSPLGPEIMLAAPLYDGIDFLGIVVAYFDMRSLMGFSNHADDIVVLCPTALLWPGKYDFASTPLAGQDWSKIVRESSAGTCTNVNGSFFYMVRYLGNLPLVFAVPEKGDFQNGNGSIEQGFAYFPQERERMTPPPVSEERKERAEKRRQELEERQQAENFDIQEPQQAEIAESPQAQGNSNELQPGSRESVLLRGKGRARERNLQERQLEGENVPVERVQRTRQPRQPSQEHIPEPTLSLIPEEEKAELSGGRPSPFGPREEQQEFKRPSPFGPAEDESKPETAVEGPEINQEQPQHKGESVGGSGTAPDTSGNTEEENTKSQPPMLPGGRPSPFGPR